MSRIVPGKPIDNQKRTHTNPTPIAALCLIICALLACLLAAQECQVFRQTSPPPANAAMLCQWNHTRAK